MEKLGKLEKRRYQLPTNVEITMSADRPPQDRSTWQDPGPVKFDLRSDTFTIPTIPMLDAITCSDLGDDVYREDRSTIILEQTIARLANKPAGLLVMSGTMGNQIGLRAHLTGPPHGVLCDARAHIVCHESGGLAAFSGATLQPVMPSNGIHLTLEDVKANVVLGDDIHDCQTKVISLENTMDGCVVPVAECERICKFAREHGIKLHMDGARLWNAASSPLAEKSSDQGEPNGSNLGEDKVGLQVLKGVTNVDSLPELLTGFDSEQSRILARYAATVDTLSMCFSKGLGAPVGSILLGDEKIIKKCLHLRKMFGGGIRQASIISAPALVAVKNNFLTGVVDKDGVSYCNHLARIHEIALKIAHAWEVRGGQLQLPVHTNMVWLKLGAKSGASAFASSDSPTATTTGKRDGDDSAWPISITDIDLVEAAAREGVKLFDRRVVVHWQVSDEAVGRLERVFDKLLGAPRPHLST